jgi:hypothetical protein
MLAVAQMPKKVDNDDSKAKAKSKKKTQTRSKRKKIDVVDDVDNVNDVKEISNLSDDLSKLSIHETKKKQKVSKIPIQRLSDTYLDEKCIANFHTVMKELSLNSKKREEYKYNTRYQFCDGDGLDKSYLAILPIVVAHQMFKEEKNKTLKGTDDNIKRKTMINPLIINDIVISSFLFDRKGHLIFHPTSKFDDFIENDDDNDDNDNDDKSKWENMDNETVLKMFKKLYNIVSKKPDNILSKKYIKYSPNVSIFIVFVKKEYKLKNANFGDKHFPWAWCRQWEMFNDWVPNTDNDGFHRSGDPYICRLVDRDNNPGRMPIRYIIRDYEAESDKDGKSIKKTTPYRITYKYIYEEIAKFNKSRGGLF